jgi:beta-N-acetylhexosaminidase
MSNKYNPVYEALGKMSLEQKAGQLFTQSFYGSVITDDVKKMIKDMNCGGLRVTSFYRQFSHHVRPGQERKPFDKSTPSSVPPCEFSDIRDVGVCKPPYLTIPAYAGLLNELKAIASERPYDIPLHLCLDQEGDMSFDFVRDGVRFFPSQWGLARNGDQQLVYDVCKANARQLHAVGFNCVHSPVLDVVRDEATSYISTRGFGSGADFVSEMASAAVRGYLDGGVMPCGKHYPGRGSTPVDDHHDIGTIDLDVQEMMNIDLAPYRRTFADGLPMIMAAHSIYPCFDENDTASCSEKILTGLARGELGFKGIITTDSVIMGAIAKKYGIPQACVLAVKAGANLILMKECGPIRNESYRLVLEAIQSGDISEDHVDQLIETTLKTKVDCGLYGKGYIAKPEKALELIRSPEMAAIERKAAVDTVHIFRDRTNLLPLKGTERVLLVSQITEAYLNANDRFSHPGSIWEEFKKMNGDQVAFLEVMQRPDETDRQKLLTYMEHFDVLIMTHYTGRDLPSSETLIDEAIAAGKKVIVLSNGPGKKYTPDSWPTVVATYGVMPPLLRAAAERIYGIEK